MELVAFLLYLSGIIVLCVELGFEDTFEKVLPLFWPLLPIAYFFLLLMILWENRK